MATLEEVRARLMKPAKDLADWSFPFSKTLEEYYTLLSKTHDINFSEPALVLQNSGNIYVRRVENLYNATTSLIQLFINQESSNQTKTCTKKNSKNTVIDFGDFEPIDFSKSVGKNTNMKMRAGINNSVKLLSQRFPHLENVSRSSLAIKVYDVHGEVIGKKSDFRCNQYQTSTGMLVEHLTPEDFSSSYETETYNNIINNNESASLSNTGNAVEDASENCDISLNCESGVISNSAMQNSDDFLDSSFVSSFDSGIGLSPQSALNATRTESLAPDEDDWDCASYSTSRSDTINNNDDSQLDNFDKETPAFVSSQTPSTPQKKRNSIVKPCSLDSGFLSGESEVEKKLHEISRSKRRKNIIDDVNDLNPAMWEPIPFEGVPRRSSNNRSTFVLPCSVGLLKCRNRTRKRKVSTESQKKKGLTELLANDLKTASKKMRMYSPTRQLLMSFKEEEFDILERCFEEELKIRQNFGSVSYEAATTAAMDLLGYRRNSSRPVSADDNIAHGSIDNNDNDSTVTSVETNHDEFPMPETPESVCDDFDEFSQITSLPSYHSRIEKTVRDIYEAGSEFLNDQQEAIGRWHRHIQPILRKSELRPPFDISEYSKRVIRCIREHNEPCIEFKKIVQNHETTEIVRYFMATLQLANTYHLQINPSDTARGDITLVLFDK